MSLLASIHSHISSLRARFASSTFGEVTYLLIGLLCALTLLYGGTQRLSHHCAFCPLELRMIEVRPAVLQIGKPAQLIDGLCNKSDHPVFTSIDLILEPKASPLATTIPLSSSMKNVDAHSCPAPATLPVAEVPDTIPLGTWRLSVRIVGRSESGQMQILSRSSNYFVVIPADAGDTYLTPSPQPSPTLFPSSPLRSPVLAPTLTLPPAPRPPAVTP